MTLFPTTVERTSCQEHKLLCSGELPTALTCIVLVVAVLLAFAGRSAWKEHYISSPPTPPPIYSKRILLTLSQHRRRRVAALSTVLDKSPLQHSNPHPLAHHYSTLKPPSTRPQLAPPHSPPHFWRFRSNKKIFHRSRSCVCVSRFGLAVRS